MPTLNLDLTQDEDEDTKDEQNFLQILMKLKDAKSNLDDSRKR
jgi:hypothetical protein